MDPRRAVVAGCVAVACALTGTATASASDAGLRKVVARQEARVTPLAQAFAQADKAVQSANDTNAASAAAGALRDGLRGFKNRVTPIKTETARVRKGKARLLDAIRTFDLGLVAYQQLLEKAGSGAPPESLRDSFVTVN
jgi:hypothetical protein